MEMQKPRTQENLGAMMAMIAMIAMIAMLMDGLSALVEIR